MLQRLLRPRSSGPRRLLGIALVGAVVLAGCGSESGSDGGVASVPTEPPATTDAATTTDAPTTSTVLEVRADDIPVAYTPPGGWTEMPPPVLDRCTEPLTADAVDMRGTWRVVSVEVDGADDPAHSAIGEVQRIEQCGDRVVITSGGIVHDMRADGTEEGAVHDVAAADKTTPITVIASFEDGVHVLRPVGVPVEIKRRIEGGQLVWDYVGFTARLELVDAS